MLARGWLMNDLTHSPFMVAMVQAAMMAPMFFLSLVGGVLADRVDRKQLTIAADVASLGGYALLAMLVVTSVVQPWHIIAISVWNGIGFALSMPGRQALVSSVVHREQLRTAVGLAATTFNSSQIVGASVAGLMIASIGTGWTFAASALVMLPAIALYVSLKPNHMPKRVGPPESIMTNLRVGLRYTAADPTLRLLMLGALVIATTVGPFQALLPVFVTDVYNLTGGALGIMVLVAGIGSLTGSIAILSIGGRVPHERVEILFGLIAAVALIGFALSPWYPLSVALVGITAFAMTSFMVSNMTVVQVVVPDSLRGRVMSVRFLVIGCQPLGAAAIGAAAEVWGPPTGVALVAGIGALAFLVVQITGKAAGHKAPVA